MHVEQVLGHVDPADRCQGHPRTASKGRRWFGRWARPGVGRLRPRLCAASRRSGGLGQGPPPWTPAGGRC